eukprot:15443673-Alexandrium_andersonii.AAC.1
MLRRRPPRPLSQPAVLQPVPRRQALRRSTWSQVPSRSPRQRSRVRSLRVRASSQSRSRPPRTVAPP